MAAKILPLALAAAVSVIQGQPLVLTEAQMDRVTAGANVANEPGNFRYEDGDLILVVTGHEGLADYAIAETRDGRAIAANVGSNGSRTTAASGAQTIDVGPGE